MGKGLFNKISQTNQVSAEPVTTENIIDVLEGLWKPLDPGDRRVYVNAGILGMEELNKAAVKFLELEEYKKHVLLLFESKLITKERFDQLTEMLDSEDDMNYTFAKAVIDKQPKLKKDTHGIPVDKIREILK